MKYVSFSYSGKPSWGVLNGKEIISVGEQVAHRFPTLGSALRHSSRAVTDMMDGNIHALKDVKLLPPIYDPGKIICVGRNYKGHVEEAGLEQPEYPSLFTRFTDTLVASGDSLICPAISKKLDFEGEMVIIIGKDGRHIEEGKALDYVFGFSIFNDASVRDVQLGQSLTAGKNFHKTGGFGPCILTSSTVENYRTLELVTRLNGIEMQHGSLSQLIFSVPALISYISKFTPLSGGDIILTGTPDGVGAVRKPPVWLKPGDLVEVEVSDIGILSNSIIAEKIQKP